MEWDVCINASAMQMSQEVLGRCDGGTAGSGESSPGPKRPRRRHRGCHQVAVTVSE